MVINYPVYNKLIRTITITPDIITDKYGNEYVVYNWNGVEMAKIEDPFSQSQEALNALPQMP